METYTPTGKQRKFTAPDGVVFHLEQVLEQHPNWDDEMSWQLIVGDLHFRLRRVDDPLFKWMLEGATQPTMRAISAVYDQRVPMARNIPLLLGTLQQALEHHTSRSS